MSQPMRATYPLGNYKISKVGNSFKISVPPKILKIWGVKEEGNGDSQSESPDVYLYAERREGKVVMLVSMDPFEDFNWIENLQE